MPYLRELDDYDLVYLAGQAKSHCVLETVNSIMRVWAPCVPRGSSDCASWKTVCRRSLFLTSISMRWRTRLTSGIATMD